MTWQKIVLTFPITEIPSMVTDAREKKWLTELIGLSPLDVTAHLEERWRRADSYGFPELASLLRSVRVESLLLFKGIPYITLFLREEVISAGRCRSLAGYVHKHRLYLRRDCDAGEFQERLDRFDLQEPVLRDLVRFLEVFGGLRESEPNYAGGFEFPDEVDPIGYRFNLTDDPRHENSYPCLFDSRGGDLLAVYPDGRTAWCCMEDWGRGGAVRPVAGSIRETMRRYADFRTSEFMPFGGDTYWEDSWSERKKETDE